MFDYTVGITIGSISPADLNLSPAPERPVSTVIMDGRVLESNLKMIGQNETWLLRQQGYHSPKEIFLGICNDQSQLTLYPIQEKKIPRDRFE